MSKTPKFVAGQPLREQLTASVLNALAEDKTPFEIRKLQNQTQRYGVDWIQVVLPAPEEGDIVPLMIAVPEAKHVVGVLGIVGENVVAVKGTASPEVLPRKITPSSPAPSMRGSVLSPPP